MNHDLNKIFPGMSSIYPEPEDKRAFVESMVYNYNYDSSIPHSWDWPILNEIDDGDLELSMNLP
jgi:hypothetical protein